MVSSGAGPGPISYPTSRPHPVPGMGERVIKVQPNRGAAPWALVRDPKKTAGPRWAGLPSRAQGKVEWEAWPRVGQHRGLSFPY